MRQRQQRPAPAISPCGRLTQTVAADSVWRGASAAAERLWASEESLGCPADVCTGIDPSKVRPGPSHWLGHGDPRFADQLCRMSMMGIKTGPTAPGFCPSDAGESSEAEVRHRLEEQVAALRLELRSLKAA